MLPTLVLLLATAQATEAYKRGLSLLEQHRTLEAIPHFQQAEIGRAHV